MKILISSFRCEAEVVKFIKTQKGVFKKGYKNGSNC